MSPEDKAACTVMAAVLDQGRILNGLSWPIAALTVVAVPFIGPQHGLLWTWLALCAAFAAALLQAYLAARVALDADLFRALGKGRLEPQTLDASLRRLALAKEAKLGRPLEQRLSGAMRLLKMQVASLVVQLFLTLSFFILLRRM
jgi:membrane protein required for beta-lactamase induction